MSKARQVSTSLITTIPLLIIASIAHLSNGLTLFFTACRNSNTTEFSSSKNFARYQSNINTLLSSLSSTANGSVSFHYTSVDANTSTSVYGLYLCRGDDSSGICRDCVASVSSTLLIYCPSSKDAASWYAECMVRFSNESFFGQMRDDIPTIVTAHNVTGNLTGFNQVLNSTLKEVANEAGATQLKYATQKGQYYDDGQSNDLYSLAQCTPDLSSRDCRKCLQTCIEALPIVCPNAQGARVMAYSCTLQYANYLFYETSALPPTPSTVNARPAVNTINSPTSINNAGKRSSRKVVIGVIIGAITVGLICVAIVICLVKAKNKKNLMVEASADNISVVSDDFDTAESLLYEFDTLQTATNNFSDDSKIGQGGFGSVYKGTLPDGKEVAIKKLSTSSSHVVQELRNEVILVAKLQHRNLLRLLGFCLSENAKLLVYEYAPNKSLNTFLFDPEKKGQLDWRTRYKIIVGVARGMLYLHEDSQLRIIHRDLKASNVLLDANMNPKISDFGIARIFAEDQTQGNTCKVVGTYGYMAPEYAMHGKFSAKSDVYSFGVLVLEIISGKRNNFHVSGYAKDLLSYAWNLWSEGTPLEFVDPVLRNSCSNNEVIRCIHLGLLCVQDDLIKRPSMAKIVLMLDSYSINLPTPQQPALFITRRTRANVSTDKSTSKSISFSVNEVTMTEITPR